MGYTLRNIRFMFRIDIRINRWSGKLFDIDLYNRSIFDIFNIKRFKVIDVLKKDLYLIDRG